MALVRVWRSVNYLICASNELARPSEGGIGKINAFTGASSGQLVSCAFDLPDGRRREILNLVVPKQQPAYRRALVISLATVSSHQQYHLAAGLSRAEASAYAIKHRIVSL
jgi:hypothetical protein